MRNFGDKITLFKNIRGVYELDTSKGCHSGTEYNKKGCYDDCYAARSSNSYGYDFSNTVLRYFKDEKHVKSIVKKINNIDMPFIRIGVTGDPSECWEHTLDVIEKISDCKKTIVIITKHWKNLSEKQLESIGRFNVVLNTSISALDTPTQLKNRYEQYNILKKYCRSVLRVVSCDFNTENEDGYMLNLIQETLFENEHVLDNVLRVSSNNEYVSSGLINITRMQFLGKKCNFSIKNKNAFVGHCSKCPDMCGVTLF